MRFRAVAVGLAALLVAFVAVRVALVRAFAEQAPTTVAAIWPGHPDVTVGLAMEQIGRAAAQGRQPPPSALAAVSDAAAAAPFAPEPYLVLGIVAQERGRADVAEKAFLAARLRAPRQQAPRYFLAELYLKTGRGSEGLREIATLARLLPQGAVTVAPAVADFARTPGAERQLAPILRRDPELASAVLDQLAKDPANAELILTLAGPVDRGRPPRWAHRLVASLVADGQYRRAHQVWGQLSGVPARADAIFDANFEGSTAPPPFNWMFAAGGVGLAEPMGGRGLHVIYYGRQDGALATQLLVLTPGRYRLSFDAVGSNPALKALEWRLSCVADKRILLRLPLERAAGDEKAASELAIPEGCAAQQIELLGTSGDVASQADVTVSGLGLQRSGS